MTINVTQEDIDAGEHGKCRKCPIALALRRAFETDDVYVGGSSVDVFKHTWRQLNVWLPLEAQDFVEDFDRNLDVAPFFFELEVHTPCA